jgi:hypothetical protein
MILTLIHNLIFSFVVVLNYWLCLKFEVVLSKKNKEDIFFSVHIPIALLDIDSGHQ